MHSCRADRMKRSACGLQFGLVGGNLGHGDVLAGEGGIEGGGDLLSRSRMRWVNSAAWSASCHGSCLAFAFA